MMRWGINAYAWQRRFAWWPVTLVTGERAWLEWVEVTGYVENREIEPKTPFNHRLCSVSFCARIPENAE